MKHQVVFVDGEAQVVTVVVRDELYTAIAGHHPNFVAILDRLNDDDKDETILDLFDVQKSVTKRFEKVSERVNIANGEVLFDGELIDNALTKQILRFVEEGVQDFRPLVAFLEKVMDNPSQRSRDQLYSWVDKHGVTITTEGDLIAYKGVRIDVDGQYTSISQGPAIVDGQPVPHGYVPNPVGAVIEMARKGVDDNPGAACSTGLHVGNWRYAESFSQGAILKVRVNPRDWVSVPYDSNCEKGRVCRYTVLDVVTSPVTSALDEDVYETPVTVTKVDTRKNHLSQKRGPNGRFLPKSA